jgi:predicted kinase
MRRLVLLRGIPGAGKSTWVKKNGLEKFTLSSDNIRLMLHSPALTPDGFEEVQDDENTWKILNTMLESRMKDGEFVVVDATHTSRKDLVQYKHLLEKYHYRVSVVDFRDVPIEVAKERNSKRTIGKVPDETIDKFYDKLQENPDVPSGFEVMKPDEFDKILYRPMDLSCYDKVHVLGDIHGCYSVLMEYLNGELKDNEFYIFVGDYIDRGIENQETLKFLFEICNKKNVVLLEGNHEQWLRMYSNGEKSLSREFEEVTKKQLISIKTKELRSFLRKLAQCAYFKYDDKEFIVTHAGISCVPKNLIFVSAKQMIRGVGKYSESEIVDDNFENVMDENTYQIHGHRNTYEVPIKRGERTFNLEGKIELGGHLRTVQITHEGIKTFEVKNNVYKHIEYSGNSVKDTVEELRDDPYIKEKEFGNISSFNFTRDAFYGGIWNDRTAKARGLYIDTLNYKVVARGYDKFFAVDEREETTLKNLSNLAYPITAYVKENGYLGLISVPEDLELDKEFFITTKSNPNGEYAVWLSEIFYKKTSEEAREKMKKYMKENHCTFVFECVDMKHDPHIIEYKDDELYLLDIIKNDLKFSTIPYDELTKLADEFGLRVKEKAITLNNYDEFLDFYNETAEKDYKYHGRYIEGFVLRDQKDFMFKLKLSYYRRWKYLRTILDRVYQNLKVNETGLSSEDKDFIEFARNKFKEDGEKRKIINMRNLFYNK